MSGLTKEQVIVNKGQLERLVFDQKVLRSLIEYGLFDLPIYKTAYEAVLKEGKKKI